MIAILAACLLPVVSAAGAASFTDQLGRTVDLPQAPARVVALAPSITEIVFGLGQARRLVGVTQFSNYPPEASGLPRVGSYIHLDLEKIVALTPDLCIGIKDGNPKAVVDRLQSMGIPVYVVDPHDIATVLRTIREVGGLLNASEKAEAVAAGLQQRLDRVDSRTAAATARPRVFVQIGIAPIISAGTQTFIHDLIVRAGGINVAAGPIAYPRFGREQVLGLAPDVIIITSMAREAAFEKIRAEWELYEGIPAVRNRRIHIVDSDIFDRPSPRLVDALELLVDLIQPGPVPQKGP